MHRFDLSHISPSPWKNGGGSTREIACFPAGTSMEQFGWRISVATIAQAGPFSAFPGIDRQIMLLDGDGVQLTAVQAGIDHALDQRWQPFAFSGDVPLDCQLLGGTSTDFNVMTRRGQWSATLSIVHRAALAGHSPAGVAMVLQGRWSMADGADHAALGRGEGLCWQDAGAPVQTLTPLTPLTDDAALVLVALTPQP